MRICCPDPALHALLADDLIQTMMKADNVDPREIETLFHELATSRHAGDVANSTACASHDAWTRIMRSAADEFRAVCEQHRLRSSSAD
jgi:hypothetical protein